MFERRTEALLPLPGFLRRLALAVFAGLAMVAIALAIGVAGYRQFAGLGWLDALLNASMILTGMGPVAPMENGAAKLFASAYALFSGVIFLSATGVMLSPVFHRLMHHFHLDDPDTSGRDAQT